MASHQIHSDAWYVNLIDTDDKLSEKSKSVYKVMINKLRNETQQENLHDIILHPPSYIKDILKDNIPLSTQESMLNVILSLMRRANMKETYANAHQLWYDAFSRLRGLRSERAGSNIPMGKEVYGRLNWKDVLKKRDKLPFCSWEHLLLSMYTYIPPRRQMDYYQLRVYFDENENPPKNHNHFHVYSKKYDSAYLCITDYKTAKTYDVHFDTSIPTELVDIIICSFKKYPRRYMFVDPSGQPFKDPNRFQMFSNKTLKTIFDNEYVSVNSLRHSFSSFLRSMKQLSMNEHQQLAKRMGHSWETNIQYAYLDPS